MSANKLAPIRQRATSHAGSTSRVWQQKRGYPSSSFFLCQRSWAPFQHRCEHEIRPSLLSPCRRGKIRKHLHSRHPLRSYAGRGKGREPFRGPIAAMKPILIRSALEEGRLFSRVLAAASVLAFVLAISQWISPTPPPYGSRRGWEWVRTLLWAWTGPWGQVIFCATVAVMLALGARWVWRHTPKRPSDRWL